MRGPKGRTPEVLPAFLLGWFSEIAGSFTHFLKETFLMVLLSSSYPATRSIHLIESYYVW